MYLRKSPGNQFFFVRIVKQKHRIWIQLHLDFPLDTNFWFVHLDPLLHLRSHLPLQPISTFLSPLARIRQLPSYDNLRDPRYRLCRFPFSRRRGCGWVRGGIERKRGRSRLGEGHVGGMGTF